MKITTLTVEDSSTTHTSIHATEDDAVASLRTNYDPESEYDQEDGGNFLQSLIDMQGLVIYIEEHDFGPLAVIATGNAFDGIMLEGPFHSAADATEWASVHSGDYAEWNVVDVSTPEN